MFGILGFRQHKKVHNVVHHEGLWNPSSELLMTRREEFFFALYGLCHEQRLQPSQTPWFLPSLEEEYPWNKPGWASRPNPLAIARKEIQDEEEEDIPLHSPPGRSRNTFCLKVVVGKPHEVFGIVD